MNRAMDGVSSIGPNCAKPSSKARCLSLTPGRIIVLKQGQLEVAALSIRFNFTFSTHDNGLGSNA